MKWNKIEDKEPISDIYLLLLFLDGHIDLAKYCDKDATFYYLDNCRVAVDEITHFLEIKYPETADE
jgi:hypothetical protein